MTATVQPVFRSDATLLPEGAVYDPLQQGWHADGLIDDLHGIDPLGAAEADPLPSAGLSLRAWRPADLPVYRRLLDDPAVWEMLPETYPAPLCPDLARDLITLSNTASHHCVRAVCLDGQPIGQVRLEFSGPHQSEISYWLGRAHWGRGLGRTLVAGTVVRAFRHCPRLLRLIAKVHPQNPASVRVLERAGFTALPPQEGAFRNWRWLGLRRQRRVQPG